MKRLCLIPIFLLLMLGCTSAAQKRRNTVAEAQNTYLAAKAVYDPACLVVPHKREDCAAFFAELRAAYDANDAAAYAIRTGDAPVQLAAVAKAEAALKARTK